jgi:hypothetical protein
MYLGRRVRSVQLIALWLYFIDGGVADVILAIIANVFGVIDLRLFRPLLFLFPLVLLCLQALAVGGSLWIHGRSTAILHTRQRGGTL